MPTLAPSEYCRYVLSPEEQSRGTILSEEQQCVIQNLISQYAREKLDLTSDPDPTEVKKFLQHLAHLDGKISALSSLLIASQTEFSRVYPDPTNHSEE